MVEAIQNWLFPKVPLVAPDFDDEGYHTYFNGARRHKTTRQDEEEYTFRCQYSPTDVVTGAGRETFAYPPLHWHRNQNESFKVVQGRVCFVLNGVEGSAGAGSVVQLPLGAIHTFWCDPTADEDAIMEFSVRPGKGIEEQWIDSFYGVLESHWRAGKSVPFLQAMVFCDEAFSAPGNVPRPIGIFMAWLFGRVIGRLAGYKGRYDIYNDTHAPGSSILSK